VTRIRPAGQLREAAVPDWLAEVVRLHRTPIPWPDMIRSGVAICVPLAVAMAVGDRALGLLIAMGGLLGVVVDKRGPYRARLKRVACAAVFGGAAGLAIGSLIHGRGWVAVAALVIVAGLSAVLTALGDVGSVTGLQLLVYTGICLGPLGALRPWWHTALGFLFGTLWAVALTVPGWLQSRHAAEQRSVATVYRALADQLAAAGSPRFAETRRSATVAFNTAYDCLLTARSATAGQNRQLTRLMALLNQANLIAEAAIALNHEGNRPPQTVIDSVQRVADAIDGSRQPADSVPAWPAGSTAVALQDALAEVGYLITGRAAPPARPAAGRPSLADRVSAVRDRFSGEFSPTFTVRLMACIGVAGLMTEVLPLTRSYWVVLTVAIVLKPDFGSVFARALQRGIGTVLGAVLGAAILAVVPYGPWLLIPFGILAALLPYGQSRNYGMFAVFLTPLVVLLIDILVPTGWHLALDRLLDTLLGCAVVLLIGYAPWPGSWHSHLPGQFAETIRDVCRYIEEALVTTPASQPAAGSEPAVMSQPARHPGARLPARSRLRRHTYRALSELRTEFQRTVSEPAAASRQASAWWPALVGLEEVVDAVTATAVSLGAGATPPSPQAVRQLTGALSAIADTVENGTRPPGTVILPVDDALRAVTEAVRSVLTVIAGRERAGEVSAA
jgi:uncharacterized membrane protein YccC